MKSFMNWPPNYRFAYVLCALGLIVCAGAVVWRLGGAEGMVMAGLGLLSCAVLLVMMPRWALDGNEEGERRARARAAREELRQSRRGSSQN